MVGFVRAASLPVFLCILVGCGGAPSRASTRGPVSSAASSTASSPSSRPVSPIETAEGEQRNAPQTASGSKGLLTLAQAEQHILELINRDREAQGLSGLRWDATAAQAGKVHAQDMARKGFTSHWGSDGSNPELRYTEAGGIDMAQENAGCFADAQERELDQNPRFDPAAIEKVEAAFMGEKPPHDGHRRNILKPWHTHVGVGLAKAKNLNVVCMAQEFTDRYGVYAPIPKQAKVRQVVKVSGRVDMPAKFVGVGVARTELPTPRAASDLVKTSAYPIPAPYVTYFPKGFVTPVPVEVHGNEFTIGVPIDDGGKTGLYEVSVWAQVPSTKDFIMVSLRTVRVP